MLIFSVSNYLSSCKVKSLLREISLILHIENLVFRIRIVIIMVEQAIILREYVNLKHNKSNEGNKDSGNSGKHGKIIFW